MSFLAHRPLTPALSPSEGERENLRQFFSNPGVVGKLDDETRGVQTLVGRTLLFPLPIGWGEGQGEGRP